MMYGRVELAEQLEEVSVVEKVSASARSARPFPLGFRRRCKAERYWGGCLKDPQSEPPRHSHNICMLHSVTVALSNYVSISEEKRTSFVTRVQMLSSPATTNISLSFN